MQARQGQAPRRGAAGPSPRPVNYNDLMLKGAAAPQPSSSTESQRSPHSSQPSYGSVGAGPGRANHHRDGRVGAELDNSAPRGTPNETHALVRASSSSFRGGLVGGRGEGAGGSGNGLAGFTGSTTSTTTTGFLEGPLPPEVRQLIEASCRSQGQPPSVQDEAERQARRLLSTNRRVKVYRDELQAAVAEAEDLQSVVDRQQLVTRALHGEIGDIDAQIARLMQERQLCEEQLAHEQNVEHHQEGKLAEAQERVAVLRNTVDNISTESQRGLMMLRQLVPHLHIENYT